MPHISSSLPRYSDTRGTQTNQPANTIYSSCKQKIIDIPELRVEIEKSIQDKKAKLAYWRAWTIPTTKSGDTFKSLKHTIFLAKTPTFLEERKKELEALIQDEKEKKETLIDEKEIAATEQKQQTYKKEIEKIEEEKQARYQAILTGAPELRAFMLEQPFEVFCAINAEKLQSKQYERVIPYLQKFVDQYEQTSPHLQTLEEHSKALQAFKKFLAFVPYTPDLSLILDNAKQIQKKLLAQWFTHFCASAKVCSTEQHKAKLLSLKNLFLQISLQSHEQQVENGEFGEELKNLAENPVEKRGAILGNLTAELKSLKNQEIIYLYNYFICESLIKYFSTYSKKEVELILNNLAKSYSNLLPKLLKSFFWKEINLYPENKKYIFIKDAILSASFPDKNKILNNYPGLPYNSILYILESELNSLTIKQNINFLGHLYNYAKSVPESELRLNIKDIIELIQSVSDLGSLIGYSKTGEIKIHSELQYKISALLSKYLQILPTGATHSLLLGMVNIFNLFCKGEKNRLDKLMRTYSGIASNKDELLLEIIKNMDNLDKKEDKSLFFQWIYPYLKKKRFLLLTLSDFKILLENWGNFSKSHQKNIIVWLEKYLYQNKSLELLQAIEKNLDKLPQELQKDANKLLAQNGKQAKKQARKQALEETLAKLQVS